jgi:signal transduction histidine kinase
VNVDESLKKKRRLVHTERSTAGETKTLLKRLLTVQEDERRRISRDLHDQLGQQLTALRMNLEVFRLQSGLDPSRLKQLERTENLAEELDRSIDFLIWQLRPGSLDHGLPDALRDLTATWSERLGFKIDNHSTLTAECRLQRQVEENLYRIAQEALNNIGKHAHSTHVSVSLLQQGKHVSLTVEDDGCGFGDIAASRSDGSHHLGLIGMRERTTLIGGEFAVETGVGLGTAIIVRVRCGS